MKEKILTDNTSELIKVQWDGERFAILHQYKYYKAEGSSYLTIILNPKEMLDLIEFAGKLGGDTKCSLALSVQIRRQYW